MSEMHWMDRWVGYKSGEKNRVTGEMGEMCAHMGITGKRGGWEGRYYLNWIIQCSYQVTQAKYEMLYPQFPCGLTQVSKEAKVRKVSKVMGRS